MDLIYKYRHCSNKYHLRLLSHGEIRFTSPLEFNDPHDCRIPIRWDRADPAWLESELREYALCHDPDSDEASREAKVQKDLAEMLEPDGGEALLEYQTRCVVSPKVGVLSLSHESAHPLMWAHYSDSHKGSAVGFDQSELLEAIRSISGAETAATTSRPKPGLEIRPVRVSYPSTLPELVPAPDNHAELVQTIATTKSDAWEYENEVRYLLMKFDEDIQLARITNEERIFTLPLDAIREVTLGVNASSSDIQKVAEILSDGRPTVRLWKASPSYGMFGLDREEIDY